MDIKDGFATSSKEHLRSLVRVHELDEITSNGGKDRSVTKEHPRGLKHKRPNLHGEPPSWTWGWHRQNYASGRGKVHKYMKTHRSEGATESGRGGPRPADPTHFGGQLGPPFLAPEGSLTLKPWRRHHRRGESHSHQEAIHKLERERREISGGGSPARRKHPQVEKKEDTVRRVTMINGAMSSTLMR
jgi:hypothetical protein